MTEKDDLIKQEGALFCLLFEPFGKSQELNSLAFTERVSYIHQK